MFVMLYEFNLYLKYIGGSILQKGGYAFLHDRLNLSHQCHLHLHTEVGLGYIFIGGAGGHCPPPLNFDNPKRSRIWEAYVVVRLAAM